jgi:hypothetical protein
VAQHEIDPDEPFPEARKPAWKLTVEPGAPIA